jgi:lysyl-tRNA synthetase class 2
MPSSVIREFRYLPVERQLQVCFTTGRRYTYHEVPADLAEALRLSFSKGDFFNRRIRGRFAYTRDVGGPDAGP